MSRRGGLVWLVVGAGGGVGSAAVTEAVRRGRPVRGLVRRGGATPAGAEEVVGDARSPEVLGRALRGVDAVVCALGPRPGDPVDTCSSATAALVAEMRAASVRRLLVVSGAMIGHPPEHLSWLYRFVPAHLPAGQQALLADRRVQESLVRGSGLDWTLVRPPRLVSGRPTGGVRAGADLHVPLLARVDRADLAAFLLDAIDDPALVGAAVAVLSARAVSSRGR